MTTDVRMTVEDWVRLFEAIGLTEEQMHRWHAEFERRHPDAHATFLAWLGMTPQRIDEVRRRSAAG